MVQGLAQENVVELVETHPIVLTGERLLAAEAMQLLMRIDRDILEARAQWNQDWFRRLMHIRPKAVSRLKRRWAKLNPAPAIPLGRLRRRYHANLAQYLYRQA
jgi:hypothetical protein